MPVPPLSVVIASRGRPAALCRAVAGLAQSDHPALEVVVVACPEGVAALRAAGQGGAVKLTEFDRPNLSAARNIGIALAAGEVVAFLDDDAVPEPTWASRLAAAFKDQRVAQAGGYVRGRNGISFQWRAMEVDALGADHPLDLPGDHVTLHAGSAMRAVKTQGTCCAFRRAVLAAAGGFDPAFRFYLDEADVNLRLAAAGHLTAVVPLAQVHHGFAAGLHRRADRVPRDLFEIGASIAAFLRRHAPEPARAAALAAFAADQRRRLLGHMVAGRLDPGAVRVLMRRLADGVTEGAARPCPTQLPPLPDPAGAFLPYPGTRPRGGRIVLSLPFRRARAEAEAAAARAAGEVVTVLRLTAGVRAHWLRLREDGIWEQAGGVLGRADRRAARLRFAGPALWRRETLARLAPLRPV